MVGIRVCREAYMKYACVVTPPPRVRIGTEGDSRVRANRN